MKKLHIVRLAVLAAAIVSVARDVNSRDSAPRVLATVSGNHQINLQFREGEPLYGGAFALLRQRLGGDVLRPLTLASGDFDEDGVQDLMIGYGRTRGGTLSLQPGNGDAIFPNSADAQRRKAKGTFTEAPFLSPSGTFEVQEAPDFLGVGDFNADGHVDVVAAAQGGDRLHWFAGDGHGLLVPARPVLLPGIVTALTTGDFNRNDGLADLIVGITDRDGSRVLVFESGSGALRTEPEAIPLPDTANVRPLLKARQS